MQEDARWLSASDTRVPFDFTDRLRQPDFDNGLHAWSNLEWCVDNLRKAPLANDPVVPRKKRVLHTAIGAQSEPRRWIHLAGYHLLNRQGEWALALAAIRIDYSQPDLPGRLSSRWEASHSNGGRLDIKEIECDAMLDLATAFQPKREHHFTESFERVLFGCQGNKHRVSFGAWIAVAELREQSVSKSVPALERLGPGKGAKCNKDIVRNLDYCTLRSCKTHLGVARSRGIECGRPAD